MASSKGKAAAAGKKAAGAKGAGARSAGTKSAGAGGRSTHGRKRRRRQKNNPALLFGIALAVLIVVPVTMNIVRSANLPGERYPSQGNLHINLGVSHVPYNSNPPTSGPHTPYLASWGSHFEPVADEIIVHNMEDRGVLLWYRYGTPEENAAHVAALEEIAEGYRYTAIVPREEMPTTYALTAWTRLQRFDEIDPEGMRAFIDAYHGIDHHP